MAERSFVKDLMRAPAGAPGEDQAAPWRKALGGDNASGSAPFSLSFRFKDGRRVEGFSGALYVRHCWMDGGGSTERLLLMFSAGGVYIEGQHLRPRVEALLEEGKLRYVQEQDSGELAQVKAHNLDMRKPEDKEPMVSRIVVSPKLETLLEADEALAEIAKVMKEAR